MAAAPVGSIQEELRLALVMNGGVSLAVWMGGVCNEIHRVVTERHPVYAQLLEMTSTIARVDVISGTSAGGVNGAALALALLYGGKFSSLRQVWLETGAFTDLLRPPTGENPGSLLQGDEFFLPHIEQAFRDLVPEGRFAPMAVEDNPIDLRLTTTLLTGVQGHNVDDLGTPLHDVDYRAYFHFVHTDKSSDFMEPDKLIPKLARAARSTASFPFAFEPSHVTKDDAGPHLHSVHEQDLELPRYVIDGGVLDNKPFEGAREAIFRMKTYGSVRRVLAYVNPDPGDGPPGKTGGDPPPLSSVLVEGLLEIPQSQTIADQLAAIAEHNEEVHTRKDSVTSIASLGAEALDELPGRLYAAYYRRRLASTFELFVYAPLSDAARSNPDHALGLRIVGKSIRQQMRLAFFRYGGLFEKRRTPLPADKRLDWLPGSWPASPGDPTLDPVKWEWGLFPVEFGAKLLLDMLRMTQKLVELSDPPPPNDDPPLQQPPGETSPHAAAVPSRHCAWTDPDDEREGPPPRWRTELDENAVFLATIWNRTTTILKALEQKRDDEDSAWQDGTGKLLEELAAFARRSDDAAGWWDTLESKSYPEMFGFLSKPVRKAFCGMQAYKIAELLRDVAGFALAEIDRAKGRSLRKLQEDLCERLFVLADRFALVDLRTILHRVMQLEVIEYTFNDHEKLNADTNIELVQISGNSASPLGGRVDAKDKLLGLQLAHFGAFYRKSWRANDWLYGRLAGAERMVKILVNPERIHRRYFGHAEAARAEIRRIAVESVPTARLRDKLVQNWASEGYEGSIAKELRFLESADFPLPDSLPYTARAITTRLHFGILAEELPELIGAIHQDQADGANNAGAGDAMLRELADAAPDIAITPDQAQRWLQNDLLGSETLLGQAGSDLFTLTLAHTTATLQGTIASKGAHLGPLSALFAAIKLPILGFFFATRGLLGLSRTSAALNGGSMILGLALVLVGFFWSPETGKPTEFPHALVTFGWALLAYSFIVATLRNWVSAAIGLVVVLVALVAYAHYTEQSLIVQGPAAFAALLTIVLLGFSTRLTWLQWFVGAILFASSAIWTSGLLDHDIAYARPTLFFATALFFALAVEAFQSSPLLPRLRSWRDRLLRHEYLHRYVGGMYVRICTKGLRRGVISEAVLNQVPVPGPAQQAGFMTDDRLVQLDGENVSGMAIGEFEARMVAQHAPMLLVRRTVGNQVEQHLLQRATLG